MGFCLIVYEFVFAFPQTILEKSVGRKGEGRNEYDVIAKFAGHAQVFLTIGYQF